MGWFNPFDAIGKAIGSWVHSQKLNTVKKILKEGVKNLNKKYPEANVRVDNIQLNGNDVTFDLLYDTPEGRSMYEKIKASYGVWAREWDKYAKKIITLWKNHKVNTAASAIQDAHLPGGAGNVVDNVVSDIQDAHSSGGAGNVVDNVVSDIQDAHSSGGAGNVVDNTASTTQHDQHTIPPEMNTTRLRYPSQNQITDHSTASGEKDKSNMTYILLAGVGALVVIFLLLKKRK